MKELLYYKVYRVLKEKIENGEYIKGDLLPIETELQRMFNVSRITIRRAVGMLSSEGFLVVMQGRGTEILDPKTTQKLNYVTSFAETLIERGFHVTSKVVSFDFVIPPKEVVVELKIDPTTKIIRIHRLRLANDKPIAIMINYLLTDYVVGIENKIGLYDSLYTLLKAEYNVVFDSAIENIGARMASSIEADMLQVSEGTPLLTSRRISFMKGKPIEAVFSSIIADKFKYTIYLKGSSF
ncbi:HTH-type transcriptional repressor NagR [subsurface metagenome]